jgi:hypothetical protein
MNKIKQLPAVTPRDETSIYAQTRGVRLGPKKLAGISACTLATIEPGIFRVSQNFQSQIAAEYRARKAAA